MFTDMFNSMDQKQLPQETFYDGYVVNAIIDAAYNSIRSKRWEAVELEDWRGQQTDKESVEEMDYDSEHFLVKKEQMPDGCVKLILRHKTSGMITQKVVNSLED